MQDSPGGPSARWGLTYHLGKVFPGEHEKNDVGMGETLAARTWRVCFSRSTRGHWGVDTETGLMVFMDRALCEDPWWVVARAEVEP